MRENNNIKGSRRSENLQGEGDVRQLVRKDAGCHHQDDFMKETTYF